MQRERVGFTVEEEEIFIFVRNGQLEEVKRISETLIHSRNKKGRSLVFIAAMEGHLAILSYLISKGCNIHTSSKVGNTPLVVAVVKNNPVGSCKYSDATIFSFHAVKSITTGEGGAITLNDKNKYIQAKQLLSHGLIRDNKLFKRKYEGSWDYDIFQLGYNFRLSDINCSLGISQLNRLDSFINKRNNLARLYDDLFLQNEKIIIPKINKNNVILLYSPFLLSK